MDVYRLLSAKYRQSIDRSWRIAQGFQLLQHLTIVDVKIYIIWNLPPHLQEPVPIPENVIAVSRSLSLSLRGVCEYLKMGRITIPVNRSVLKKTFISLSNLLHYMDINMTTIPNMIYMGNCNWDS
jgi:hypothetical protein